MTIPPMVSLTRSAVSRKPNSRIRGVQRIGRRGLSTAVIEGMPASSAPYLAVIDADLEHDETALPRMLGAIKEQDLDVVVGSRHTAGGGIGEWDPRRVAISGIANRLARLGVAAELSDPMSGFLLFPGRPSSGRSDVSPDKASEFS